MKISTKISLSIILTALLSVLFITTSIFIYTSKEIRSNALSEIEKIVGEESVKIENELNLLKDTVDNYISILKHTIDINEVRESQEKADTYEESILGIVKDLVEQSPGKNVWFQGNTLETKSVMLVDLRKEEDGIVRTPKWDIIGSGFEKDEWWRGPLENGTNWSEPYQWDGWGKGTVLVSYGKKFEKDGRVLGVVGSEFFLNRLQDRIEKIKIVDTGYMVLLDEEYNVLYHPNNKLTKISDFGTEIYELFVKNFKKESGIVEYSYENKTKYFVYKKLSNGWILGASPVKSEMFDTLYNLIKILIMNFFVISIIGVILSLAVGKSLTRPIKLIAKKLIMFSKGNLEVDFEIKTKDEVGIISKAFTSTIRKIKDVLLVIDNTRASIITTSQELKESNQKLADNVYEQASSLEETTASLKSISDNIIENTKSIEEVNSLTEKTVKKIKKTRKESKHLKKSMKEIMKSSVKIEEIVDIIEEIAFQTNLLSLNTAVESAKAGKAGRGFAVISSEIRNLAQRSSDASKEIKTLIQENEEKIKKGKDFVDETYKKMNIAVEEIEEVASNISIITKTSEEGTQGITQINEVVNQLEEITEENASFAEETSAISESLNEEVKRFSKIFKFFRLKSEDNKEEKMKEETGVVESKEEMTESKLEEMETTEDEVENPEDIINLN